MNEPSPGNKTPDLAPSNTSSALCVPSAKFGSKISDLCKISVLFVSYFASQSEGIKFDDYFFDVCCAN